MKILTTLLLATLLAGCSMLAPDFDNHAYGSFVNLHTHSVLLKVDCARPATVGVRLNKMKFLSTSLVTYSSNIPNNKEVTSMATIIDNDIQEIMSRNDIKPVPGESIKIGTDHRTTSSGMSKTYCELKAKQLIIKLDEAINSVGAL